MIANVWSLLAKSSRGDCTEWPCTFNPSRANVIDRDAFNLGRTVAATNQHQFRNPQWSPTYGRDWQLEPWRLHRMAWATLIPHGQTLSTGTRSTLAGSDVVLKREGNPYCVRLCRTS